MPEHLGCYALPMGPQPQPEEIAAILNESLGWYNLLPHQVVSVGVMPGCPGKLLVVYRTGDAAYGVGAGGVR